MSYISRNIPARVKDRSPTWVKSDTFGNRLYGVDSMMLPGRIRSFVAVGGQGLRSEFFIAGGQWILYARNMINRAIKYIPGEGSTPAHLVAQPMTHGVATPSRFQIRASFVSGRAIQKIQSPFFLTFPLSARDRRSFANNVADRRVPEVSDLSPFLLVFFPSLFFIIATRATFLTQWSSTERIYTANWKAPGLSGS